MPAPEALDDWIKSWEAAGLVRVDARIQFSYALRALGFVAHGFSTTIQKRSCYTSPDGAEYARILQEAPILMKMRRGNMTAKLIRNPELRDAFRAAFQLGADGKSLRAMIEERP